MIEPYDCVIMANGSFPQADLPLGFLRRASVVIACDGAIASLDKAGIVPTAIVGDLDSLSPGFRERYADRIHLVEDQEVNDLTKSILFAHRSGYRDVLILGATGMREDHTLGNISLLMEHACLFRRIEMLSDYGLFTPLMKTATLMSRPGIQVSLFSLSPSGTLSASADQRQDVDGFVARHSERGHRRQLHRDALTGSTCARIPHIECSG